MATKFEQLAQKSLLAKQAKEKGSVDEFLRDAALEKKKSQKINPFAHLVRGNSFSQDDLESVSSVGTDEIIVLAPEPTHSLITTVSESLILEDVRPDPATSLFHSDVQGLGEDIPLDSFAQDDSSEISTIDSEPDDTDNYLSKDLVASESDIFELNPSIKDEIKGVIKGDGNLVNQKFEKINPDHEVVKYPDKYANLSSGQVSRYAELARQMSERRAQAAKIKDIGVQLVGAPAVNNDSKWMHSDTPAGSNYSPEEWLNAKGNGNDYVFEVRNQGESVLLRVPKRAEGIVTRNYTDKKSGAFTESTAAASPESTKGTLSPLMGTTWDGCLLLSPSAVTTHPGSISGEITFKTGDKYMPEIIYRIVRPESHRETLSWLYGVKGSFQSNALGMPDRQEINSQPERSDYAPGYEPEYLIDRPRG